MAGGGQGGQQKTQTLPRVQSGLTGTELDAANNAVQRYLGSNNITMGDCENADSELACQQADAWWTEALDPNTVSMGSFVNAITPKVSTFATEEVFTRYLMEVLNQRLIRLGAT